MKIINQASFAMDDVKLFLDTHPSCSQAIEYYKKVKKIRMDAVDEYPRELGPITAYDVDVKDYWNWNDSPLPWEGGNC